jgi:hypothetical protein
MTYSYGRFRRSYKRDGRHGLGWMVTRENGSLAVAKVDTEEQAQAVVAALESGLDPRDTEALRRIVRAVA